MDLLKDLIRSTEDEYGASYKEHCLEIYKTYLEMADRISGRRQSANSFFLTINTALIGLVGYVQMNGGGQSTQNFYWLVSVAGIVLCYLWYRIVKSYKDLNSGKFKVIHEIEKQLPLSPYDAEWTAVGRGEDPKLYLPFTRIEMIIPWIFLTLHGFVCVYSVGSAILMVGGA
jgi:hypothetical protein